MNDEWTEHPVKNRKVREGRGEVTADNRRAEYSASIFRADGNYSPRVIAS
jgi:hypothetical protein